MTATAPRLEEQVITISQLTVARTLPAPQVYAPKAEPHGENVARNFAKMGLAWLIAMIATLSLFVLLSTAVHYLFG